MSGACILRIGRKCCRRSSGAADVGFSAITVDRQISSVTAMTGIPAMSLVAKIVACESPRVVTSMEAVMKTQQETVARTQVSLVDLHKNLAKLN